MNRLAKITFSLLLLCIFLIGCIVSLTSIFVGGWLHTYQVLTQKTLVAEVTISERKSDADGEYVDVTYKPYVQASALTYLIEGDQGEAVAQQQQSFKLYGDTVHIGGPVVKFYDHLILLNFQTIYKVGKIYGRYNLDNQKEVNRKVQSSYDLNGGIDNTWQQLNENINQWPYDQVFETTQLSIPGVFVSPTQSRNYKLYITNTGFLWEQLP